MNNVWNETTVDTKYHNKRIIQTNIRCHHRTITNEGITLWNFQIEMYFVEQTCLLNIQKKESSHLYRFLSAKFHNILPTEHDPDCVTGLGVKFPLGTDHAHHLTLPLSRSLHPTSTIKPHPHR